MKPLVALGFFSLACFYLIAAFTTTVRYLTHQQHLPWILKFFYVTVFVQCLARFISFAIAATIMTSDSSY